MKKRVVFLCLLSMCLALPAWSVETASEIELTRSVIQTQKKAIIAKNMAFTEAEAEAFWPVFREYQQALQPINDRKVTLIMDYAENFEKLSNDQAKGMIEDFLNIQKDEVKLKKKFVRRFSKVIPIKKVARYYQLENKMDSVINIELAANIPLIQ